MKFRFTSCQGEDVVTTLAAVTDADGATARRHVPDYLLRLIDGTVVVVDVKPAGLLAKPTITEVLV